MSRITCVETAYQDVELKSDFHISHTVMKAKQQRVFVKITDDQGNYGLGEAATLPFFNGEEAVSIKPVIDQALSPEIIGLEAGRVRKAVSIMDMRLPGNHTAKTAIEMALWDLAAKEAGLPVCSLLGGKFRDRLEMAYVLSLKDIDQMAAEAENAVSQGYRTLKTKLTGDVNKDVEIIGGIREAVGMEVVLRADANSAYSVKDGLYAARQFEPYRLEYLEQPCCDIQNLKYITDNTTVPIAADESLLSISDGYALIKARAVNHLVIKLIKVGGILAALRIAGIAEIAGIGCTLVSPIETSVGAAAGVAVAAVAPAAVVAHELKTRDYLTADLAEGLQFEGSVCIIGDRPGLGVELNEDIFA